MKKKNPRKARNSVRYGSFIILLVFLCGLFSGCTRSYTLSQPYINPSYVCPPKSYHYGVITEGVYRNGYFNLQYVFTDSRWKVDAKNCIAKYNRDYLQFQVITTELYQAVQPEDVLRNWIDEEGGTSGMSHVRNGTVTIKGKRVNSSTCKVTKDGSSRTEIWTVAFVSGKEYALGIFNRSVELESPYYSITRMKQTQREFVKPLLGKWKTKSEYQIDTIHVVSARKGPLNEEKFGYPAVWFDRSSRVEVLPGKISAGKIRKQVESEDKYNTNIQIRMSEFTGNGFTDIPVYRVSWEARKQIPRSGALSDISVLDKTETVFRYASVYVLKYPDHFLLIVIPEKNLDADTVFLKHVISSEVPVRQKVSSKTHDPEVVIPD